MIVGSFASTFWGRPRMTHDADLVAEITAEKVTELARLLAPHAVCFERRLLGVIFGREVWVSSPEDVILSKLLWYRAAPGLDRQFRDVIEVYEIQEPYLDQAYLDRWASALGLADLLERVRQEAVRPPED
jgi:predicted nucleotidyltransferase